VDDKTALAIDENKIATAYGSGCVSIYHTNESNVLKQSKEKLVLDSLTLTQLIDGKSIDLTNFDVSGFDHELVPQKAQETGNYTIFASGGNNIISENESLLDEFAQTGDKEDTVLILTGNKQDTAKLFEDHLNSLGVNNTEVYPATSVYSDNVALEEALNSAGKYLFVKADWSEFKKFMNSNNGKRLLKNLRENGSVSAFIGDNSRFAGKTVVLNYDEPYASYEGTYQLDEGLGLFKTSVLIPNTFSPEFNASYSQYENTAAAIPYAMVKDTLAYGIWLTRKNYIKYQPDQGYNYLNPRGEWPVMVLKNEGTSGEIVSRGVSGPDTEIRMLGGFESMQISIIDSTISYKMGKTTEEEVTGFTNGISETNATIYHDHDLNRIRIDWEHGTYTLYMFNTQGQKIMIKRGLKNNSSVDYPDLPSGIYIIHLQSHTGNIATKRLFLQ
jgi:hypothetical protein